MSTVALLALAGILFRAQAHENKVVSGWEQRSG
jgi:hypothetical protein